MRKETIFKLLACLIALSALSCVEGGPGLTGSEPTLTWLGTLGGGHSTARGVSNDGVVVGWSSTRFIVGQVRAFRWTAEKGMQDLGTLGGRESQAFAVSGNGRVVVGRAQNASGVWRAFVWIKDEEWPAMRDLNQVYASLLQDGSHLTVAYAISLNGRFIVGEGFNAAKRRTEAFLLDTGRAEGWWFDPP